MDRTINVAVNGEFVRKDSKNAGVQGEANVTTLHISLSRDWEQFGKRIVWRDALGENPVAVLLYHSINDRVDSESSGTAKKDPLVFDTPIPAEPLALEGWCSFTIEGFRDGEPSAVAISVTDHLLVKPNDAYNVPAEPTPTQAQQLQTQIETVVPQVAELVQTTVNALEQAEKDVKVWTAWDSKSVYLPLQKVSRLGSSYICKQTCAGIDPAVDTAEGDSVEGTCWLLIAKKGDKGEQGAEGPQGLTGPQGIQGIQGEQGERGAQGIQGVQGPQGAQGATGAAGPRGPAGPQGVQGPAGPQGQQGPAGKKGDTGAAGAAGSDGLQGPQGEQGPPGPRGEQGQVGPQGEQGVQGPPGPRGIDGVAVATSGMVAFNVSENGHLLCSYTGDEQPNYYIGDDGHLYLDV